MTLQPTIAVVGLALLTGCGAAKEWVVDTTDDKVYGAVVRQVEARNPEIAVAIDEQRARNEAAGHEWSGLGALKTYWLEIAGVLLAGGFLSAKFFKLLREGRYAKAAAEVLSSTIGRLRGSGLDIAGKDGEPAVAMDSVIRQHIAGEASQHPVLAGKGAVRAVMKKNGMEAG